MKPHCVTLATAAVLLLTACDPGGSAPADPRPATPQSSAAAPTTQTPTTTDLPAQAADNFANTQQRLTQTLRKYSAEQQRVPSSLNDLVTAGYLQSIPTAPGGKKWTINPKRLQVELD